MVKNSINRRRFISYGAIAISTTVFAGCGNQSNQSSSTSASKLVGKGKLDKVTFGTNWYAQAEHGGFYQAIATGIYEKYGLDVTIKMGNAQVNPTQLLMGGVVDFFMGGSPDTINAVAAGIPKITVAAIFQKDPQVLIAHPGTGNDALEKLKDKPIMISAGANSSYWPFLVSKYGYKDAQKRPYNSNIAPFLADKNAIQQGYVTSEPYTIEQQGKFKPVVMLLADYGYSPYDNTIETTQKLVDTNPDLVQRFVDASIQGWYSYLENPIPGNQLIKKDNPQMSDGLLKYGLQKMKEYAIVVSGDAVKLGIGAMTEERWKSLFQDMVKAKIVKPDLKYEKAFTLKFINKGVRN